MANKVRYGLKNAHYAVLTEGAGGITFGTPVAMPGAVSLDLSPEGDTYTKYADNIAYFVKSVNNGYSGSLELTVLPDSFRVDVLGEKVATGNALHYEVADASGSAFALLFQFEGDETNTRYALYNCTASRPNITGATVEDSMEVQDETFEFVATPLVYNGETLVKGWAKDGDTTYATWFETVALPTA